MQFNDDKVIEVLQRLPSEEPCVDYKIVPYKKNQNHDFLKDVIAMLNSEAGVGKDKFIILGVENQTRKRIGIQRELWRDDNEWQNLLDKIIPRPDVSTGCVEYEGNWFGYVLISGTNNEWVYEAAESVISSEDDKVREKNIIAKGQAYTRRGSKNYILMADGRKHLLEKKLPDISVDKPIVSEPPTERNVMITLAFIGAWDEKRPGDTEVIEKLSKTDFQRFTEKVRAISEQNRGLLSFSNGCWKLKDHKGLLISQADYVFDDHIDLYQDILDKCFKETDPKYELSPDIRALASLYNKNQKHFSRLLCSGLVETLAILGNMSVSFNKCSRYKISNCICLFERRFFKTADWKIYATYAEELQLLGEACPDVFLEEIGRLASEKDAAFIQFMTEKEESLFSSQYGYQLGWIIAKIAALEKYFSKAMAVLLSLAEIRPEFLDTMVGIVLPWFPQTHAPISMRVGVFSGLAKENADLTWKVLMKLMPRATTVANPIQEPKYMKVDALPETVTMQDYRDASIAYIRVANELMGTDVERMSSMISVIDDVDSALEQEIIQEIQRNAACLTHEEKATLWNILQDFVHKHRKYADAEWALSEDRLALVDALAEWLVPDSNTLFAIRLFKNQQFSLLEEKGNYEKEEAKLRTKQIAILQGIYDKGGVKSVLQFTDMIENVRLAGICASSFLSDTDIRELLISSADISTDAFLHGIIRNLSFDRTKTILEGLPDTKKAKTLAILPLCDRIIEYIKGLEEESQSSYWKNIDAWGWLGEGFTLVEDTIRNLNGCGKTATSISILHSYTRKDESRVTTQLVAETLIQNVDNKTISALDTYDIQELIKWLQERNADRNSLILIEWKYLAFLREDEGYPPITLWEELSSNPEHFIYILKIFTGKERGTEWTDEDKSKMVQHCYHLLESWKRTPGLDNTGRINKDILDNWVSIVKDLSIKSGIEKLAMMYFGKAAFYAPADEDGFFMDKEVVKYLQEDKDGSILSGYHSEAINSRGVHTIDPTGEAEFKIEEQYMAKARAADEKGLFRFAGTLREIAESYHEEGIRNKELG